VRAQARLLQVFRTNAFLLFQNSTPRFFETKEDSLSENPLKEALRNDRLKFVIADSLMAELRRAHIAASL